MSRRSAAIATAIVLALGALAAVAYAASVPDRDDVAVGLDIAKASGTHNRATDELVQTIDTYEAFKPADLVTDGGRPPGSVCFEIWTTNKPGEQKANYEACATPDKTGNGWIASLSRARLKGPPLRVATLKVEQPTDTRLVVRIKPDDIRRPASYRWRAETTSFASDCKSASGCPDYAPDRPDTVLTRLGKPRS